MEYLYRMILEPFVPFLPLLLFGGAAGILFWFVRILIRPN
jgi:hypothetical protein